MPRVVPHFWFDTQAKEAAELYVSLFPDSQLKYTVPIEGAPGGDGESVSFVLAGQPFEAISAGPSFSLNPSVSMFVSCQTKEEVQHLWDSLRVGGKELMELGPYPFSPLYGWVEDRFGLSWQLVQVDGEIVGPKIKNNLLFAGQAHGKAQKAIRYYADVFPDGQVKAVQHYPEDPTKLMFSTLYMGETEWTVMDHNSGGDFTFNEAASLMVLCKDQKQIDYYWEKLSAVPEAEQCGWVKDTFGVSWQIVPETLGDMLAYAEPDERRRIMDAVLKMKKLDMVALRRLHS